MPCSPYMGPDIRRSIPMAMGSHRAGSVDDLSKTGPKLKPGQPSHVTMWAKSAIHSRFGVGSVKYVGAFAETRRSGHQCPFDAAAVRRGLL